MLDIFFVRMTGGIEAETLVCEDNDNGGKCRVVRDDGYYCGDGANKRRDVDNP